jgi:hypothetical protein
MHGHRSVTRNSILSALIASIALALLHNGLCLLISLLSIELSASHGI